MRPLARLASQGAYGSIASRFRRFLRDEFRFHMNYKKRLYFNSLAPFLLQNHDGALRQ